MERIIQNPPAKPSPAKPQSRPTQHQTITVTADLTPAEIEEGKLNDLYQDIYKWERHGNCEAMIEKYKTVIIPKAEQAEFEVPKNKFLFLSYRGMASCKLSQGHFAEAEALFQKALQFATVWPTFSDSGYPIILSSIGAAQMRQDKWNESEETLRKAVAVFDEQIELWSKSDSEFMRTGHSANLRRSQAQALNLLAVACYRQQKSKEALPLLERAFQQAIQFHAPSTLVKTIVENGVIIADASGESAKSTAWAQRARTLQRTP